MGLKGKVVSKGLPHAMPFPVMVCLGVNDVLFDHNVKDSTPVFPGNMCTLVLTVSGTEICCKYNFWDA